ncbi:MAG: helix-turn-helix transcriptional regulator [Isosphaeraceae bacterium]|jgi:transcriptional regulator with XRE-family HTH domain
MSQDKMSDPDLTMSEQLRHAIRRRGLTAYKVAKDAGVSHTIVQRFLDGDRGLKLDSADKIARALRLRLMEDPSIFTMTILKPDTELLTRGESMPGENWRSALLRLIPQALGDGIDRRIQMFWQYEGDKGKGKGFVDIVRIAGPRVGMAWPVEHFLIETDPPQL